jgi:hypothetical protein
LWAAFVGDGRFGGKPSGGPSEVHKSVHTCMYRIAVQSDCKHKTACIPSPQAIK